MARFNKRTSMRAMSVSNRDKLLARLRAEYLAISNAVPTRVNPAQVRMSMSAVEMQLDAAERIIRGLWEGQGHAERQ